MEKVRPWRGQRMDRGRPKTEQKVRQSPIAQLTLTVSQLSVIVMTTAGHVTCQPIAVPERTWVS